ncbi:MAG: DNA polymerase I [Anaerolineales bacterium]
MTKSDRLYLIDGHALAYRAYFALTRGGDPARWMTTSGEPTAGTYGFTSVILRLLEQESPEYLAVSFDVGKTFRDEMFAEYKGTREKMPDDLRLQIKRIREVVAAFGIPILEAEGFEADDVLGTVAKRVGADGVQVIILTGDRDLLQLVDDQVVIRLAGQKLSEAIDYGPKQVKDKYKLDPAQLVDLKAMVGDKSDNIPGVAGVGEKTATSLLQDYDDLEGIYAHIEDIPPRFSNKLEAGKEEAELSRKLGEIVTDVPLDFNLESCRAQGYDRDRIVAIFRELEFRTLLDRLAKQVGEEGELYVGEDKVGPETETIIVDTAKALEALEKRLSEAKAIAFDVETTAPDAANSKLVGISLAVEPGKGYYLPVGHLPDLSGSTQLELEKVIEALKKPLTSPKIEKVGHNLKFDYTLLARNGLAAEPLVFDTMMAEWLSHPSSRNLGLKSLAWVRLGIEMTPIDQLIGSGRKQKTMAEVPIADAAPYAAADAEICLRLRPILEKELKERSQESLFNDLEMPLIRILAAMEMTGISLDTEFLAGLSDELAERLGTIEAELFDMVGHSFNVNSTQQLSDVLFEELELKPPDGTRRTASGKFSTAADVLASLKEEHEAVALVLEHREISKLKSTYADSLREQINPQSGRVHTSYSQTGAITGRIASSNPNLQNIPIRTELGRQIRRAFVASRGHTLLAVDYSQIELRVVAHVANDKTMIKAFREDQDIHSATAAAVFGADHNSVTSEQRRRAKAVNFGLIYGMSPFGLTRATDMTLAEAENFVDAYFENFPGVSGYIDDVREKAAEEGYTETLLGRRRYFPQLAKDGKPGPAQVRARAEREAVNSPIQGSAADIIKLAMIALPNALEEAGLSANMLLQVHDELVFEVPKKELKETAGVVQEIMQGAYKLKVPLKTDAKSGPNWEQMKPLKS